MNTTLTVMTARLEKQIPRIEGVPPDDGYYWYYKRGAALPSLVMIGTYNGERVIMEGGKYQKYWLPGEFFVGPVMPPAPTPVDLAQSDDGHGEEIWIGGECSAHTRRQVTPHTEWDGCAEIDKRHPTLCLTEVTPQGEVVRCERFTLEDVVVEGLRVQSRNLAGEKEGAFWACAADLSTELHFWREKLTRGAD